MDETSFKILGTLSRELGVRMSISELTEKIDQSYGNTYYANIYNKLKQLESDNIVKLDKVGNTTIVSLNFKDYWIVDVLTQVELWKKQEFLGEHIELQILFRTIETQYENFWENNHEKFESSDQDPPFIRSVSAIRPSKNERVGRLELLILLRGQGKDSLPEVGQAMMARLLLQYLHSQIKIHALILPETKFLEMLSSEEVNPVKEMLSDKIAFFGPQNFWQTIRAAAEKGMPFKIQTDETIPVKIPERDLVYNMARFGYKEMGTRISQAREICLEYVMAGMITQEDARRIEAVPILISKNRVNYDLLIFLSQKFKFSERLLGLLTVLAEIIPKDHKKIEVQFAVKTLEDMKIRPILADKTSIMEKLRLYNAA